MSPASCNLILSSITLSSPSRKESSDREICPSCEVGSRFRDIARCLSSKDSLMWSANRKYWFGLAMVLVVTVVLLEKRTVFKMSPPTGVK